MRTVDFFCAETRGATAIEYALLAALIALVILAGVTTIGDTLSNTFNDLTNAI